MAESADGEEKSEEPTEKKLRESREKGQVARSRELTTFLMVISASLFLYFFGQYFMMDLQTIMEQGLTPDRAHAYDLSMALDQILAMILQAFFMVAPFFLLMAVVAIVASSLLGGFNFSAQAMSPQFSKMNPIKGIKRMFSMNSLMELLKALAKFTLVLTVAITFLWIIFEQLIQLSTLSFKEAMANAGQILVDAFVILSLALIVIALIDVPYQLWQHNKQLKMTKQEVKEEHKQQEGNPQVKARIRQVQREMVQRRMMQRVPEADVVITNPTHYAVALVYKPGEMDVPLVVAAGQEYLALQIRSLAAENDIPIVEAPLLARALYYNCEIEEPIPNSLFKAVAAVLAYVFGLRDNKNVGLDLDKLEIPADLRTS